MVMTTDLKAGAAKDRPSHKSSFKKTGKTEQILGYKAEQWPSSTKRHMTSWTFGH